MLQFTIKECDEEFFSTKRRFSTTKWALQATKLVPGKADFDDFSINLDAKATPVNQLMNANKEGKSLPDDRNVDELKNLEFLVCKSRELLKEQIASFENTHNKSGVLLSILAIFTPFAVTYVMDADARVIFKILSIIPLLTLFYALFKFLRVLTPKGLDHGFNFTRFEGLIGGSYRDLLLYEIGANRSSFDSNHDVVSAQIDNFKNGVRLVFLGSFLMVILVTSIAVYPKDEDEGRHNVKELVIENLIIRDTLKKQDMGNNNSGNSSGSSGQSNQGQQQGQPSTQIPDVPSQERANFEKGDSSKPITKK